MSSHEVYWGSHGCDLGLGHVGWCRCACCQCVSHPDDKFCVGSFPYYNTHGIHTELYGAHAAVMQALFDLEIKRWSDNE